MTPNDFLMEILDTIDPFLFMNELAVILVENRGSLSEQHSVEMGLMPDWAQEEAFDMIARGLARNPMEAV